MQMCMQMQLRAACILSLKPVNGAMLHNCLVQCEAFLRTSRGQEALHVLGLAFTPSLFDKYDCVLDLLYGELVPNGRREVFAFYRGDGKRLIRIHHYDHIAVWDGIIVKLLHQMQELYELFLERGWKTGVRTPKLIRQARSHVRIFTPSLPSFPQIQVTDEPKEVAS